MALNASDVNAGDDILATHHNALLDDIEQHDHDVADTNGVLTPTQITVTPGGAVVAVDIVQAHDAIAFRINTESANQFGATILGKYGTSIVQDITGGMGLSVIRADGLEQIEVNPLVKLQELNAECTQPVFQIENAGLGYEIFASNFTVKGGYVSTGGNEALRWDVVEFNLDGTSSDQVAYTLDGVKCKGMYAIGLDVDTDNVRSTTYEETTDFTICSHSGTDLFINYGALYVAGDDAKIIVFTTV